MSGENVSICKERPTLSISLSLQHILVLFDLSTHIRPAILSALRNQRPLFLQLLNPMKSSAIHLICYTLLQIIWFHLIRTIKITSRHGQDDLWLKLSSGFRENGLKKRNYQAVQAAGGDVMVWGIFSWHALGPLIPTEHRLNGTEYYCWLFPTHLQWMRNQDNIDMKLLTM